MIRPSATAIKAAALIAKQSPEFLEFVREWRAHEFEQLPQAITNPTLYQGRCQVLAELYTFLRDAPQLAAKSG